MFCLLKIMIIKTNFNGSPHIGIFTICNEDFAIVPKSASSDYEKQLKEVLDVDIIKTNIADANFLGIYSAMNSKKILVPDIIGKSELKTLKEHLLEVIIVGGKYNAIGNLVAMNDHGTICTKEIGSELKKYIKVKACNIADNEVVGSVVCANNDGFIAHRDATDEDLKLIEKELKVKGEVGTVNFGDPYVKCGIVLNSKGILVGELTSGPELNRIDDIFILSRG